MHCEQDLGWGPRQSCPPVTPDSTSFFCESLCQLCARVWQPDGHCLGQGRDSTIFGLVWGGQGGPQLCFSFPSAPFLLCPEPCACAEGGAEWTRGFPAWDTWGLCDTALLLRAVAVYLVSPVLNDVLYRDLGPGELSCHALCLALASPELFLVPS